MHGKDEWDFPTALMSPQCGLVESLKDAFPHEKHHVIDLRHLKGLTARTMVWFQDYIVHLGAPGWRARGWAQCTLDGLITEDHSGLSLMTLARFLDATHIAGDLEKRICSVVSPALDSFLIEFLREFAVRHSFPEMEKHMTRMLAQKTLWTYRLSKTQRPTEPDAST